MERLTKGMRIACGFSLLMNLVVFFLPLTQISQVNYATINYSQLNYVTNLFQGVLPHSEAGDPVGLGIRPLLVILFVIILPVVLSLIAGIVGVVGSARQKFTSIVSVVTFVLYILLAFMVPVLWTTPGPEQVYSRGIACVLHVVIALVSVVFGIIALVATPRKKPVSVSAIPQIQEIKMEQERQKYNIIDTVQPEQPESIPYDSTQPKGVLRGLTGMYQGAEIPFRDGESIRLGRLPENDLVFENQSHVSRKHCVITWLGAQKKFKILDYSSSGSYINGSDECIPQNIEVYLEVGTTIDIGDSSNRFRLE